MTTSTGSKTLQKVLAFSIIIPTALVLMTSIGILVSEYVQVCMTEESDEVTLEKLVEEAREDSTKQDALKAERDRQTVEKLARARRNNIHAMVIAVAAVFFLLATKWLSLLKPTSTPGLDLLREIRGIPQRPSREPESDTSGGDL